MTDTLPAPAGRAADEDVVVRPARPKDAASFLEMYASVAAEGRLIRSEEVRHPVRDYRSRFRRSWTDEEAHIVAVVGDRVIGHVSLRRDEHPVTRHVATLGMAVAADRRGRGVGTRLLSEAIRWARSAGVLKLLLSVYPDNERAIALYRRFGFAEEGRLARQSRKSHGFEDEILMARWLGEEPAE